MPRKPGSLPVQARPGQAYTPGAWVVRPVETTALHRLCPIVPPAPMILGSQPRAPIGPQVLLNDPKASIIAEDG
jgi:hypothetical protein